MVLKIYPLRIGQADEFRGPLDACLHIAVPHNAQPP